MKRISLIYLLAGAAFLLPVSCVREELSGDVLTGRELILDIDVEGMATRAAGDAYADNPNLKEDAVEILDIYVHGTFSVSNQSREQVRHYHLTSADQTRDGKWKVLDDWQAAGYVSGNSYEVYVAANSKRVKNGNAYDDSINEGLDVSQISTLAGLQTALKGTVEYDYDPTEPNNDENKPGTKPFWGEHNDDKLNPEWLDLHKKYIPESTLDVSANGLDVRQKRFYTNEKSFLMDGTGTLTVGGSMPLSSTITLYRAAAKIELTVQFDSDFLTDFGKTPDGYPAWEFVNFAFSTPVFDSGRLKDTYWGGVAGSKYDVNSIFTAGAIMMSSPAVASETDLKYVASSGHRFTLSTYSYPLEWTAGNDDEGVPGIIVSVHYSGEAATKFHYYKIPVVDPSGAVTSLDRNKVYKVSATIASEGGDLLTDAYEVKCRFDIIGWGTSSQNTTVTERQNYYFSVSPTDINLRGDGLQTAEIKVYKPDTKNIGLQYWVMSSSATHEDPLNSTGGSLVEYPFDANGVAQNAPAPYYFNHAGTRRNVFVDTKAQGGVTYGTTSYLQNKFTRSEYGDNLTLESYSLPNKGIKYMKVRVYLNVNDWYNKGLYQDITIRHYPTDYITSIQGAWSSRISAAAAVTGTYHKDHNDANRGPEEYTIERDNNLGSTRRREVCNGWDDDTVIKVQETTLVDIDRTEYEAGLSGPFPEDFSYEIEPTDYADWSSNHSSDDLYDKEEETYSYFFRKNSVQGVTDKVEKNKAYVSSLSDAPSNEAHALEGVDGYYYWGNGSPQIVGSLSVTTTQRYSTAPDYTAFTSTASFTSGEPSDYDFYTVGSIDSASSYSSGGYLFKTTFTFYKYYDGHLRAKYEKPQYKCVQFHAAKYKVNSALLSTSNDNNIARRDKRWVNVDVDGEDTFGATDIRTNSTGRRYGDNGFLNGPFNAKRYKDSDSRIYDVVLYQYQSYGAKNHKIKMQDDTSDPGISGTNPHIYIIRFSESSSRFAIGHPATNGFGLSKDNVVAPALMIASQLGGTNNLPNDGAGGTVTNDPKRGVTNVLGGELMYWSARHCNTYLEVGRKGVWEDNSNRARYYFDWRLPTKAEIEMIIGYQGTGDATSGSTNIDGFTISGADRVLTPVLEGENYRALNGDYVPTGRTNPYTHYTIRCVRELTLEELKYLENL